MAHCAIPQVSKICEDTWICAITYTQIAVGIKNCDVCLEVTIEIIELRNEWKGFTSYCEVSYDIIQ